MNSNKRIWFKRKKYGYGWTPSTWEGWAVIVFYMVLGIAPLLFFSFVVIERYLIFYIIYNLIEGAGLFYVCKKFGETPKWQWGNKV